MLQDLPENHHDRTIAQALSHVRNFGQAVDCGAHRGIVTRKLLKRFSNVVAIEPGSLHKQIDPRATVINAALDKEHKLVAMADGTENTGQRHVVAGDQVQMITLDSLKLAPDFIKIDVEGLEYDVLLGGEQTIQNYRPVIMVEENGLNQRYGIPDMAACALLYSWGARRVERIGKDYVFTW